MSRFVSGSHSSCRIGVCDRYEVSFRCKDTRQVILITGEVQRRQ